MSGDSDDDDASWARLVLCDGLDSISKPELAIRVSHGAVPDALRGRVWLYLAEASPATCVKPAVDSSSEADAAIDRDLQRTFPLHPLFEADGALGQSQLSLVLRNLARSEESVGYCQGLGFISAFFLLYLPPHDTLALLQSLLRRYDLARLMSRELAQVRPALAEFSQLVATLMPDVHRNFSALGIDATMYASPWLITLFTSQCPLDFVARFMDRFLAQGWPVWFRTALGMLQSRRRELAAANDLEACLGILKAVAQRPGEDVLIANVDLGATPLSSLSHPWSSSPSSSASTSPRFGLL